MRTLFFFALSAVLVLTACGRDRAGTPNLTRWEGDMPIQSPWVRERLPRGSQAYLRIPHPAGLLAAPKGNMFDAALASDAHVRNLIAIQEALLATLTANSGLMSDPRARTLLDHLQSPIEIAGSVLPLPTLLIGMTLDLRADAEFEALFADLAQLPPLPRLAGPLDDSGYANLLGLPVPAIVNFDERTGRLAILGGVSANRETLERQLGRDGLSPNHPMAALEAQIDDSGQGYFSWLDTSEFLALSEMMLPPETRALLQSSGIARLESLAIGMGVANGKGRLKLVGDVGGLTTRRPFPVIRNEIAARSVGAPTSLVLLSVPDPAEFSRLEELALGYLPVQARSQWLTLKGQISEALGVSLEDIFNAIGPELIAYSDRAGDFIGLKVRDSELLAEVLAQLSLQSGTPLEERRIEGQTIRHVSLPGIPGLPTGDLPAEVSPWLRMLAQLRTRLYWVEEGGYLYIASLPQLLVDRGRLEADTRIDDWLEETQRLDLSAALLAATGSIADLPRKNYQFYVSTMQQLADFVGAEYDVWSMPTAADLDLPERGALGFSFNLGDPYVSMEFSYESHPFEVLFSSGGYVAMAGIGIAAAIAIPAYQDYTIRAQVAEGMNLASAARAAVAQVYLAREAIPADRTAAGMTANAADTQGRYVQAVDIVDGAIVVTYGNAAQGAISGESLIIRPYRNGANAIVWVCGYAAPPPGLTALGDGSRGIATSVPSRYLPSACR